MQFSTGGYPDSRCPIVARGTRVQTTQRKHADGGNVRNVLEDPDFLLNDNPDSSLSEDRDTS